MAYNQGMKVNTGLKCEMYHDIGAGFHGHTGIENNK